MNVTKLSSATPAESARIRAFADALYQYSIELLNARPDLAEITPAEILSAFASLFLTFGQVCEVDVETLVAHIRLSAKQPPQPGAASA